MYWLWIFWKSVVFLTFFRFSQNNPFTEKRQKCQKTTLLQKFPNQYNFMLKIHLGVPLDILCFTLLIYGPIFLQNYFLSGIFIKFWPKNAFCHVFLAIFGPFSSIDPHFQVFRFLQPHNMYTFSESPGCKLSFKL